MPLPTAVSQLMKPRTRFLVDVAEVGLGTPGDASPSSLDDGPDVLVWSSGELLQGR